VSCPTWNSAISAGKATLTIVAAVIVDTVPSITVAMIHPRWRGAIGIAGIAIGRGVASSLVRRL
jgi:hypothetical protein